MGTAKVLLSLLLSLSMLASFPAVRSWTGQCEDDAHIASVTDTAAVGGQCHIRTIPEKQAPTPGVTIPGFAIHGLFLCKTEIFSPESHHLAATDCLDLPFHGDIPVFLKTQNFLI
jgi:hypothetical protein